MSPRQLCSATRPLGLTSLTAKEGSFMMKTIPNHGACTSNQWPGEGTDTSIAVQRGVLVRLPTALSIRRT